MQVGSGGVGGGPALFARSTGLAPFAFAILQLLFAVRRETTMTFSRNHSTAGAKPVVTTKANHNARSAAAHAVKAVFDQLESRTLMSFSAMVNFATPNAAKVSGYVVDSGATYGARNGLTYGWNTNLATWARNRDASNSPDQRFDTLIHMRPGTVWEMAVPNGKYDVTVVSGDPSYWDSIYSLNVEGKAALNLTPSAATRWTSRTIQVTVDDGKLTLSNGAGAVNNKLNFVQIVSAGSTGSSLDTTPPAAASALKASALSTTQLKLTWTDNSSRESGYRIERSSDGGNTYTFVTNVAANMTSYTDSGRSAGTTYRYRVAAYNDSAVSSFVYASGKTLSPAPTPTPTPTPTPSASGYIDGVHMSLGETPSKAIPVMQDLGVKGVRLNNGLTRWSNRWAANPVFQKAIAYHNAGLRVVMLTTCTTAATYAQAKAYFQWAMTVPGLKNAVDQWEIQNEIDLSKYYDHSGNWSYYVNNDLKGAWDALHPAGEKVISGAGYQVETEQGLKNAGVMNYSDSIGFHLYARTPEVLRQRASAVKALFGSKPIDVTEWNFRPTSGDADWGTYLRGIHSFMKATFASAYYYRWSVNDSFTGHAGLVNPDYTPHNPFYDAFKSWKNQ
jgi:hypothetical protein